MKLIRNSLFALAASLMVTATYAVPVHVNTGDYAGNWRINGTHTGAKEIDLAVGDHSISISWHGFIDINVAEDGTVTSLTPEAATGGASALTFKTANVTIDPANYQGNYSLTYVLNPWINGLNDIAFVTGLEYNRNSS